MPAAQIFVQSQLSVRIGRISVVSVRKAPNFILVLVAAGQFKAQQVRLSGQGPELAGALEAVLQLRAGRFHCSRAPGASPRLSLPVMQVLAMVFKVITLALKRLALLR